MSDLAPRGTFTLEKLRVAAQAELDRRMLEACTVDVFEHTIGRLVVQMERIVYAEKLQDKTITVTTTGDAVFMFPTSPWQHFKLDHRHSWWLRWLLRRRPTRQEAHVRTVQRSKRVVLEQFATYPEAKLPPAMQGPAVIRFERARESFS